MKNIKFVIITLLISLFVSCSNGGNTSKSKKHISPRTYKQNIKALVSIQTFDHYNRLLKQGYGFYISPSEIITNLSLIKGCKKVYTAPMGTDEENTVAGYLAIDFDKDLVLLKSNFRNINYFRLKNAILNIPDSVETLFRKSKKIYASKFKVNIQNTDSVKYYFINNKTSGGLAVFNLKHQFTGIVSNLKINKKVKSTIIPVKDITKLFNKRLKDAKSIYELRNKTNKVYPSYKKIKGFEINTTMGKIRIRLFNKTPKYRDNFIKLVCDNFYDSLLVHRVLPNFLIQMGAADSRYAKSDDLVGWQGPGYSLETKIVPGLFHWRGAIAASKLPPSRNPKNKTDGSQFYIVSGKKYSNEELDGIEKERKIKFTKSQRKKYTTIGGAPHLDGEYTVFGEVISGMNIVDKIAAQKVNPEYRPINDIRIKNVKILYY